MSYRSAVLGRARLTLFGLVLLAELVCIAVYAAFVPGLCVLFTLWALQLLGLYVTGKRQLVHAGDQLAAAEARITALTADLHQALIDPVTGLPGRRLAEQYLDTADGTNRTLAVIDIDRMHDINHDHGHAYGDSVLAGFAALFRRVAVDGDQIARLGGDEFLLITDRPPAALARSLYRAMRLLADPNHRPTDAPVASASAGISTIGGGTARTALGRADLAMGTAKRRSSRTEIYDQTRDGAPSPANIRPLRRRRDRHTDPVT